MGDTRWGHSTSKTPERWSGSFATREEAIEDGKDQYGEGFWLQCGAVIDPYEAMPKAEDLFTRMGEYAYDNWGLDEEFPDVSQEGLEELDALLKAWCRKHLADFRSWMDGGFEPERIEPTAEELAAWEAEREKVLAEANATWARAEAEARAAEAKLDAEDKSP